MIKWIKHSLFRMHTLVYYLSMYVCMAYIFTYELQDTLALELISQ